MDNRVTRLTALICSVLLIIGSLCGCSDPDAEKAASSTETVEAQIQYFVYPEYDLWD